MSNKNIDKINYSLSGQLEKLSTSVFIGFQPKFFSILQNGTKIGYRNLNETQFKPQNAFLLRDCVVCQAQEQFSFTLETPKRTYTLKGKDEMTKIVWMRTITQIRKQIIRKKFKLNTNNKSIQKLKIIPSSTQNTLPNFSMSFLHETQRSLKSSNVRQTQRSVRVSSSLNPNPEKDQEIKKGFQQLLKIVPQYYVKNNTYIATLKSKVENLFTASFNQMTYIMFSSKSLYLSSDEQLSEENLTNMMLPPWAEVNKMYKLTSANQTPKLLLQISKIIDIEEPKQEKTCIKVRTQEMVHSFYCQTVEEKDRLKQKFQIAIDNYKEAFINGKLSRKNYDNLVRLYTDRYDEFVERVKQIVAKFIPNNHHYEPQIVIRFIDTVIPWIQEFVLVLNSKKQKCTDIILQVLKELHDEIKIHIKLTWDTSYSLMKGEDILKFLNALAAYHSIIKTHITDIQFMTGMKQLSKIYVREAWKNFEDIILGIVEQQKKNNIFKDEDHEYIETNGIIDLFKFIYEVFDLAAPCWEHKLHLHNVQKLMCRAISVFIDELKAVVDQTVMGNKQLIAITNNYFRFCITVDEFYNQKFSELQQKTKQGYERLKTEYKELSNIIMDKLAFDVRASIKRFFEKGSFFKLDIEKLCEILKQSSENIEIELFHPIFVKRFYEKLFTGVREGVLSLLEKEVSSKKKHNVTKILQTLDSISFDLIDVSKVLYNGKSKIDKQLNEVNILLSCESHNQILKLIKGSGQDAKRIYLNLVNLREDYYPGGALFYMLNDQAADRSSIAINSINLDHKNTLHPTRLTISMQRQMRASFSSYYISHDFDSNSSVDKSQHDYDEPLRLISEGYLLKCKTNKKVWQKEYFRLKNGTLYFFQNEKSEKCQNSILVSEMIKVYSAGGTESSCFIIEYVSLNRQKHIDFKCETVELCERWLESLSLELKRVKNDEKVKKQKLKLNQKNKNYLIIDYDELMNGKGFFSYTNAP